MLQFAISSFVYSWLLFPPAWECAGAPCTTCVCFDKKIYSHQKSYVAWDFCSFYALLLPHLATWSQHGHVCTHSVIVGILCDQTSPSAGHSLCAFTMSKTNHSTSADKNLACWGNDTGASHYQMTFMVQGNRAGKVTNLLHEAVHTQDNDLL